MDLFDYGEGKKRRDKGMKLVRENNPTFSFQYYHFVLGLPIGWIGNNEDIMKGWIGVQPGHVNAWGSNFGHCKRKGLIVELVERRPNENVKSNGRRQNLYMRVKPKSA